MASLCFLFYLNYCIYFHILVPKTEEHGDKLCHPSECQGKRWISGMSASSVYLRICFVFLYVCRFFIAFDFAFFPVFCNKKNLNPV